MKGNPSTRLHRATVLIGIGLVASMVISWKLWVGPRAFPKFPVFSWIPQFPDSLALLLTLSLFALLALLCFRPPRSAAALTVGIMIVFALQDQMRWQPWFYQYLLMLAPFAFLRNFDDQSAEPILAVHRLTLISIYLWSGIHKCHSGFISVHEGMVKPLTDNLDSASLVSAIARFGYAIPAIEILMALGLLFRRTRPAAIITVIVTHITILILIGPVKGEFSNLVVWPWNIVMAALTFTLFHKVDTLNLKALRTSSLYPLGLAIACLTLLAPLLFHFERWDRYLAFNLYGGWQKRMLVKVTPEELPMLPPEWQEQCVQTKALDGHYLLSPYRWSSKELEVPFVTEWRIIRSFSRELCQLGIGSGEAYIYVDYSHLPDRPKRYFSCSQIDQMRE